MPLVCYRMCNPAVYVLLQGASDGWSEHYRVVFLRVWSMILAITALPTDGRKEVRSWMSRVAITTVEMVGASVTGEEVLKGALDVLHKLANFPDHVSILCVCVCVRACACVLVCVFVFVCEHACVRAYSTVRSGTYLCMNMLVSVCIWKLCTKYYYIESEPLFDRKPHSPSCNGPTSIPVCRWVWTNKQQF